MRAHKQQVTIVRKSESSELKMNIGRKTVKFNQKRSGSGDKRRFKWNDINVNVKLVGEVSG